MLCRALGALIFRTKHLYPAGTSSQKRCSKSAPLPSQASIQQPPVIMVRNGISFLQNNLSLVKIAPTDPSVEAGRSQGLVMSVDALDAGSENGLSNSGQQYRRQICSARNQNHQQSRRNFHEQMSSVQHLQPCLPRMVSCSTIHQDTEPSPYIHRGKIHHPKNRK